MKCCPTCQLSQENLADVNASSLIEIDVKNILITLPNWNLLNFNEDNWKCIIILNTNSFKDKSAIKYGNKIRKYLHKISVKMHAIT